MHITYIWHKFNLHGYKIVLISLFLLSISLDVSGQNSKKLNLISYDDIKIHYGFLIAVHSSKYRINYDDAFVTDVFDTLHSIVPSNLAGFKVACLINLHLLQYLDLRMLVTVGFYQNDLTYRYTNNTQIMELQDPTYIELPFLLKYKSARRGNIRMYLVGGLNPSIQAVGSNQKDNIEKLNIKRFNLALEFGVGLDMYQPFFKFSPEIRYSYGLINVLERKKNTFSAGLKKITLHNIGFFITFEGGATEFTEKKRKKRKKN